MGATPEPKRVVKTKRELERILSAFYTDLAWKRCQAVDSMPFSNEKEKVFEQYAEMLLTVQELSKQLAFAGGFE